ncbi:MAG: putative lipid II flippase FtsW [Gammaproteobacteria bacterium]|jgi:cell division protein FtsW
MIIRFARNFAGLNVPDFRGRESDPVLIGLAVALVCVGLVLVASASVSTADRELGRPFYYLERQAVYAVGGLIAASVVYHMPLRVWQRSGFSLLLFALFLLALVLVPGIGHQVNGSTRWLGLGMFRLQVSEPARLCLLMYLAGYIVRRQDEVRSTFRGFVKPMVVMGAACLLLLLEPDFGAASVLLGTAIAMLFIGGVRLRDFSVLVGGVSLAMAGLALSSPYRVERLTAFLNPWADPFNSGFQLTQSLIAIGRGGWFGVGLGASVQKLFYLPEAHTDFVFAVLGEELGLAGTAALILLYMALLWRCFRIAHRAAGRGYFFGAYLAYGITVWLGLQAFINMGVNMGILPTKGLTLPLISYGGSSLLASCVGLGLVLRVAREAAQPVAGAAHLGEASA